MTQTIDGRCIDPIDPQVHPVVHGVSRGLVILWSPSEHPTAASDRPSPETDSRNFKSARTERAFLDLHDSSDGMRISTCSSCPCRRKQISFHSRERCECSWNFLELG